MEGSLKGRKNKQDEASLTIVPRAGVNQTLFRILLTGPEDVIPVLARYIKKCIFEKHNISNLKIHHAVSLNEEIAKRLHKDGLHAVVLCTDSSKSSTKANLKETLGHLDFYLVSTSMFILNLINPLPAIFSSVVDAVEKLSIVYDTHIVNIHYEDEESIKFGIDRIVTAALRRTKFIYGYETPTVNNIDFTKIDSA